MKKILSIHWAVYLYLAVVAFCTLLVWEIEHNLIKAVIGTLIGTSGLLLFTRHFIERDS